MSALINTYSKAKQKPQLFMSRVVNWFHFSNSIYLWCLQYLEHIFLQRLGYDECRKTTSVVNESYSLIPICDICRKEDAVNKT